MFHDLSHPEVTLLEWRELREEFSRDVIAELLDRSLVGLPECMVPLARGVAIASPALLLKAGHRPGMSRPRGWRKTHCDVFVHDIGYDDSGRSRCLMVRQCDDKGLWTIERWSASRTYQSMDEILVHQFGSTPIMTRSYQSAMRLATHCHAIGLPPGLRWIEACPNNCDSAIESARARGIAEAHLHGTPSNYLTGQ
jgi:hypothetical protein